MLLSLDSSQCLIRLRLRLLSNSINQKENDPSSFSPHSTPSSYKVSGTFGATTSVQLVSKRFAHTDVPFPDFTSYRRDGTKDPASLASDTEVPRRAFTYFMVGGMGVLGVHAGKAFVSGSYCYFGIAWFLYIYFRSEN